MKPHLNISQMNNLYVFITTELDEETEQFPETLAENMLKHGYDCAFNIRSGDDYDFFDWNLRGWNNPFAFSSRMVFDLTTW